MAVRHVPTFADQLRHLRRASGLSQEELAERANISVRALRKLESGATQTPRRDTIDLLASALRLDAAEQAAFAQSARLTRIARPSAAVRSHPRSYREERPLVGRLDELALIERHRAGHTPPFLAFSGEPGIGKSRLLMEGARLATEAGWRVITGGCTRRSGQAPFEPVVSAFARVVQMTPPARLQLDLQGCGWLVRLLPELLDTQLVPAPTWTLPPDQERRLMFGAVARYLVNIAGPAGTLLVLDDLQWADADALALLETLVAEATRGEGSAPLLLLGAYRSTEVHSSAPLAQLLADMQSVDLATQAQLIPLGAADAGALLDQWLTRPTPHPATAVTGQDVEPSLSADVREEVLRHAEGIPYYLVSTAQALQAFKKEDEAGEYPWQVPWTVANSIRARIAMLPEQTRALLGIAAVIGRVTPSVLLMALVAHSHKQAGEDVTLAALEAACAAGLLRDEGAEYHFVHDLIREVTLADLSAARARLLHRRVAKELARGDNQTHHAQAAEIASHYLAAGEQAQALPYALMAGNQAAAVYAHEVAEAQFRMAIKLADACRDERLGAQARLRLGHALSMLGRFGEALPLVEEARVQFRTLNDREEWAQSEQTLAIIRGLDGYAEESLAHLLTARNLLEPIASARDLALVYHWLSNAYLLLSRHREELASAEQAFAYARQSEDPLITAQVEMRYGGALIRQGRVAEGCAMIVARFSELARIGDSTDFGVVFWNLVDGYLALGEFSTVRRYVASAVDAAEVTGDASGKVTVGWFQALVAFYEGKWEQAQAGISECCQLSQAAKLPLVPYYLIFSGHLLYLRGARDQARAAQDHAVATIGQRRLVWLTWQIEAALADQELLDDEPAAAAQRLASLLEPLGDDLHFNALPLVPRLAQAYLDMGKVSEARAAAHRAVRRATDMNYRLVLTDALRVRAMISIRQRRWKEAFAALEEALTLSRAMPYPYAEAKALYVYGQLHAARSEPEQAREQYRTALAICARLGEGLYRPHIERALADLDRGQ
jgi:transcriptional regulator with XRE-family HTH domain/tetratricopeptide (TPR) repeat protein